MEPAIGVLVVEDNRMARDRITTLLKARPGITRVAAADGPDEGMRRAREAKPDVVVVNAFLGDERSQRFVANVRKEIPDVGVVVMDLLPADRKVVDFAQAGAIGFVAKRATIDDLAATVQSVAAGTPAVPPPFAHSLVSHIAAEEVETSDGPGATPPPPTEANRISIRERQVIALIGEGLSNKEIAQRLNIAVYTVKSHVHNILGKFALHTRLQLAARAQGYGRATTHIG